MGSRLKPTDSGGRLSPGVLGSFTDKFFPAYLQRMHDLFGSVVQQIVWVVIQQFDEVADVVQATANDFEFSENLRVRTLGWYVHGRGDERVEPFKKLVALEEVKHLESPFIVPIQAGGKW
ncbi:MAG: hypothetical protein DWI21_13965 [Planctomycetota bacterium]|nr:MAG: hypothetical protein DWI21_13965 [Planctomycetota bacterium]